jgi:hypothetical protein
VWLVTNEERSGQRNFLPLSSIAREVFGVRHQDIDLIQYCPSCKRPEMLIEATSSNGPKFTQVLRVIGDLCNVPVLMVRHEWNDVRHEHPIDLYMWEPGSLGRNAAPNQQLEGVEWTALKSIMLNLHERHNCNEG